MLGALALAAGALAGAAHAQPRYDFGPGDRPYDLHGPGVRELIPELRDTPRGRAFVMRNFDFDHDGFITPREAREANRAFLQAAGPDRGRFDWDHPRGFGPPPPPIAYDPGAMRSYHFRQGRYGAMFTLDDVLFETGSAALKPGAVQQLRPLAGFLRARSRVRLRIDGYTDSVGSQASNMTLSRNRAQSVADALAGMGVDRGRFLLEGHGEAMPVAPNDNPAGRQRNRRVEVTLVGQRAESFR